MSENETVLALFTVCLSIGWILRWYNQLCVLAHLGCPRFQRWPLALAPLFCSALIFWILRNHAAAEVRASGYYILLFTTLGFVVLALSTGIFSLMGISVRDDALERHNGAAVAAICGAMVGVTLCYAGGNIGEGLTIWTTIFPAALSVAGFFLIWFVVEWIGRVSQAITEERNLPSGLRLAGCLVGIGLILGRSVAGTWHSEEATVHDFLRQGWPALFLGLAAAVVDRKLIPVLATPRASLVRYGIVPAIVYLGLAVGIVLLQGRVQ